MRTDKRHFIRGLLLAASTLLAGWAHAQAGGAAPAAAVPALPVEAFFNPAEVQSMKLSPSGRFVVASVSKPGSRGQLVVSDLEGKEPSQVLVRLDAVDIEDFEWVNDELLVFELFDRQRHGDRQLSSGLASVTRKEGKLRLLIKTQWESEFPTPGIGPLEPNHVLLQRRTAGTDEILIGEVQYYPNGEFRAVRPMVMNARTGSRRSVAGDLPTAQRWMFDRVGRPRLAVNWGDDGKTRLHWHDLGTGQWRQLYEAPRLAVPFSPEGVDDSGRLYVTVLRGDDGHEQLATYDFDKGEVSREPLASTPGFDDSLSLVQSQANGELLGIRVLTDARSSVWFNPTMQRLQQEVDRLLPGFVNRVSCSRCDDKGNVLVHAQADRHPGLWLVRLGATGQWQRLADARGQIDPARMGGLSFHRAKARDGAGLPVWITRPAGDGPQTRPRAAVVLVHGGPHARGTEWAWNDEAQFLASRGYVVIEPEFRGSTGYGYRHYRAGWKQWGLAMQDDIADAVAFAAQQGWVDSQRVCLMGGSYGGYATLMGLAKTPDAYRCGVAMAAVSDPRLMFSVHWSDISNSVKRHNYRQTIGDPDTEADKLAAVAPLELADRIKAPLLLAHGNRDFRVPLVHAERMRDALRKNGREPKWLLFDGEGHGFVKAENRIRYYREVGDFLARHLPP